MQALVAGRLAWTVFALVPVVAGLLRLLYRRRERFFVPHPVFALHCHTLGFLLMAVGIGVDTMLGTRPNVSSLAFLAAAVMLFPSLRRVYAEGRLRTIGKQIVLLIAYGLVVLIGMLALVTITSRAAWQDRPESRGRRPRTVQLWNACRNGVDNLWAAC